MTETDRKFTAPGAFPATYKSRIGVKAVVVTRMPDERLLGYFQFVDGDTSAAAWCPNGTYTGIDGGKSPNDIFDDPNIDETPGQSGGPEVTGVGMSEREFHDRAALAAMVELCSDIEALEPIVSAEDVPLVKIVAVGAFEVADAMLEQRRERTGENGPF